MSPCCTVVHPVVTPPYRGRQLHRFNHWSSGELIAADARSCSTISPGALPRRRSPCWPGSSRPAGTSASLSDLSPWTGGLPAARRNALCEVFAATTFLQITDAKEQFREEGYFILDRALPDEYVVRDECQRFIDRMNREMDRQGWTCWHQPPRQPLLHPPPVAGESRDPRDPVLRGLCGNLPRDARRQRVPLLGAVRRQGRGSGDEVQLAPGFRAGRPRHTSRTFPWCALDDVSEENGTVYVLPYSRAGTREVSRTGRKARTTSWDTTVTTLGRSSRSRPGASPCSPARTYTAVG